jgi:ADP-ribose pyrophosphatase YjhB (NUDIX family)
MISYKEYLKESEILSVKILMTDGIDFISLIPNEGGYDLLGGEQKEGETYRETAIREIKEETGYDVNGDNLILFKRIMTRGKKDYYILYIKQDLPDIEKFYCNSKYKDKNGNMVPEIKGYEYKSLDNFTGFDKTFTEAIKQIAIIL